MRTFPKRLSQLASAFVVAVAVTVGGCGYEGPPRVAATGSVVVDGQPLKSGFVQFVPLVAKEGMPEAAPTIAGLLK